MYDVFVSYRRGKGSDLASFFDSELKKNGFTTYLDINSTYTGNFEEAIKSDIKKSRLFVLIITEGSLERFISPKDITRIELETALKNNIPVLPVSVIGDKMFEVINSNPNLPECVNTLKDLNTRFYQHEMRADTLNYIIQLAGKLQEESFKEIANSAFNRNIPLEDSVLSNYVNTVKDKQYSYEGKTLFYTGNTKFGNPFGHGILADRATGLIYTADWSPYEKFTGRGKIERNGKLVYEGELLQLKYEGQGHLVTNEYAYTGEFRDGKINGIGVLTFNDGTVIKGRFLGENCCSVGYISNPDGSSYYGKIIDNKPNGYGVLTNKEGNRFDGYFRNGVISEGSIYYPTYVYIGDIQNFLPHGRGNMYMLNFDKMFEGSFRNGKSNGNGTFILKGDFLGKGMLPKEIYEKLKQFYPSLDTMGLQLKGYFSDNELQDFNDFSLTDSSNLAIILEGYLRNSNNGSYKFKIFKDYEEVYEHQS